MTDLHDFVVDRRHTPATDQRVLPRQSCRLGAGPASLARPSSRPRKGSPDIANQDESGRNRNERQEHDRKTRSYEETTGNPYHLSKGARMLGGLLAVVVVITLTALFLSGAIRW